MSAVSPRFTIRSLFLWVIMAIASITLALAAGLSIYQQITTYREDLETTVVMLADMLSQHAEADIAVGDITATTQRLASVSQADLVTHVHAYWYDPDQELTFLASYNREGEPAIGSQAGILNTLRQPQLSDNRMEVARPVMFEDKYVGYIYLSASAANFHNLVWRAVLLNLAVLVVMMLLTFLLAWRLQHFLVGPITALSEFVQGTARSRDYGARTPPSGVYELNNLNEAINVLLARIQDTLQRQAEAEAEHQKLNASLEEMVHQRTLALKDANLELIQTLEKLHQYQRQLVENEKMASLGDMVAGVAHEVNTPIGLGVTASSMMLDNIEVVQKHFRERTLKASALEKFLTDSSENLNIIFRNLNRAAELISSFKQVAVDQTTETPRTFCVSQLINEILLSLRPQLKKHQHNINIHCDPTLHVTTQAGPINQILINLIVNSVVHGFEGVEHGTIDITAQLVSASNLKLVYRDNGNGIPEEIRKRIFDPFVTTRRGQGGSGLGMHLVYNLVTQALNGSITLSSEEGNGVEFMIVFPVETA